LLFADEFVPTAEDTQHIVPLWELMLTKVRRQIEAWHRLGSRKDVAVNVEIMGNTLLDADFILRLSEQLLNAMPAPFRLALGIPEAVASRNPKTVQSMMQRLRQRQSVRLVLDDFGAGTSALSVLRDLSVDVIRLDQSLIVGGHEEHTFTAAVIALAHALNIRVVADGIRSAEQLADMRRLGCDYVQGSYISAPVDAAAAEAMLGSTSMTGPEPANSGAADMVHTADRRSSP
jgi:EAL domain-containing protein (putative c-di-GMP-specific phosphodiesterase class I)